MSTVILLVLSNIFMTYAWYGHLRTLRDSPWWLAVLASWGVAFFEYALQVPANRLGYGRFVTYFKKKLFTIATMTPTMLSPAMRPELIGTV